MSALFDTDEEVQTTGEQVGEKRLGTGSMIKNFGLTYLVIIAVLIVIILLIAVGSFIIKRAGYQGKCQQLINKLKRKIFFNFLIA